MSAGGYNLGKTAENYIKLRTKVVKRIESDVEAYLAKGGKIVEYDRHCQPVKGEKR